MGKAVALASYGISDPKNDDGPRKFRTDTRLNYGPCICLKIKELLPSFDESSAHVLYVFHVKHQRHAGADSMALRTNPSAR